jgi:hypothetical protein
LLQDVAVLIDQALEFASRFCTPSSTSSPRGTIRITLAFTPEPQASSPVMLGTLAGEATSPFSL